MKLNPEAEAEIERLAKAQYEEWGMHDSLPNSELADLARAAMRWAYEDARSIAVNQADFGIDEWYSAYTTIESEIEERMKARE